MVPRVDARDDLTLERGRRGWQVQAANEPFKPWRNPLSLGDARCRHQPEPAAGPGRGPGRGLRLMLLTAQRRGEAHSMRWKDLTEESSGAWWTIPARAPQRRPGSSGGADRASPRGPQAAPRHQRRRALRLLIAESDREGTLYRELAESRGAVLRVNYSCRCATTRLAGPCQGDGRRGDRATSEVSGHRVAPVVCCRWSDLEQGAVVAVGARSASKDRWETGGRWPVFHRSGSFHGPAV